MWNFLKRLINQEYISSFIISVNLKTYGNLNHKLGELLAIYHKRRISKVIDRNKKTIVISFTGAPYKNRLGNIPKKLRDKGFNVLSLVGPVPLEDYEKGKDILWGGCYMAKTIAKMFPVDAYICIAPQRNLPTNTKIIMFVHDIHDSPEGAPDATARCYALCNYFFLPSGFVITRIAQQVEAGRKLNNENPNRLKTTCLIPGGYPKLDSNIRNFETLQKDAKILIYAPTVMEASMAEVGGLQQYGDQIIAHILDKITNFDLIFRPHPSSLAYSATKMLIEKYRNHPRFFVDQSSGYEETYSKSALMITDLSGTAFTYAFMTLRPVVFFSPNESKLIKDLGHYQYFKDRNKIGEIAYKVDELADKIMLVFAQRDELKSKIRQYRDTTMYNVGKSEDYFVDRIENILKNHADHDWIYV